MKKKGKTKMGCDIHTVVEIKNANGNWIGIDEVPKEFSDRNYSTFAFLADVRNSFNTKGFKPKGWPEDMSEISKEMKEKWEDDGHSPSFLTLKELDEFDKSDYCATKCKIVAAFYDKFKELGGVLPEGMSVEEPEGGGSIMEILAQSMCPDVIIKWPMPEAAQKETLIFKGIEALKEIAKKSNIDNFENIRIVFCFDN